MARRKTKRRQFRGTPEQHLAEAEKIAKQATAAATKAVEHARVGNCAAARRHLLDATFLSGMEQGNLDWTTHRKTMRGARLGAADQAVEACVPRHYRR